MKSLKSVHLCKHDIGDDDLKFVASLPKIVGIEFNADATFRDQDFAVTDRCSNYLSRATTIKDFAVQGHGKLTDVFVSNLTEGLPNLEHLRLRCPKLTDESLRCLAIRSKKIKGLDLASNGFTDAGMGQLSKANSLETLLLDSSSLTGECVSSVAGLHQFQQLGLTIPSISNAGVRVMAQLPRLEILVLRQPALSDNQFSIFRNHPTLKSAFINGNNLTSDCILDVVDSIPSLEHLSVTSSNEELQAIVNQSLEARKHPR